MAWLKLVVQILRAKKKHSQSSGGAVVGAGFLLYNQGDHTWSSIWIPINNISSLLDRQDLLHDAPISAYQSLKYGFPWSQPHAGPCWWSHEQFHIFFWFWIHTGSTPTFELHQERTHDQICILIPPHQHIRMPGFIPWEMDPVFFGWERVNPLWYGWGKIKPVYVVPVGICLFVVVKKKKPTASWRRLRWSGSVVRVTPHGFCRHLDLYQSLDYRLVPVLGL